MAKIKNCALPDPCRVSSVLNRDIKQYGKVFMFDGEEETCWNSDRGSPQTVTVELPSAASVCCLEIRFQGGFATREGVLLAGSDVGTLKEIQRFYPADDNTLQVKSSPSVGGSGDPPTCVVYFWGPLVQLYGALISLFLGGPLLG